MPTRDHAGAALRRPAVRRLLPLLTLGVLALLSSLAPAVAAARTPMDAAREVLSLTDRRLSLMDEVMVTKWLNRSPIEDRVQEGVVIDGALALTRPRGLADAGVRDFFTQQITAAKEVQLGWGDEWLMHGFPADTTAPDLTALRGQLAALNPQIVDALADLGDLRCQRGARAALMTAGARLVRTRFVTPQRRAELVDALLSIRRDASAPCRVADTALPVREAHGVRIVRRGGRAQVVFTRRAKGLWAEIAGKTIEISCTRLGGSDSAGIMDAESMFGPRRAPSSRRPLPLGTTDWGDYCAVALRREDDRSLTLDTVVTIPVTQAGAVVLDERVKAGTLVGVLGAASSFGDDTRPASFATPALLTSGRIARMLRREGLGAVALDSPDDTPPTGVVGYWSDGGQHAAAVTLSSSGRRLYAELGPDQELRTNVAGSFLAADAY